MATKKQLAALAKARKARAANLKKKTVTRKRTPKSSDSYYIIYSMHRGKKFYYTGNNLDDEVSKARTYTNKYLADAAIEMAKSFGKTFKAIKK